MFFIRFLLCIIGIVFVVLLISTVTVKSSDNVTGGTPGWVLDMQRRYEARLHAMNVTAQHFSIKAHNINVTAQCYKCTLDILSCQKLFWQIIVYYEEKIIKAKNDDLKRNFPNLGSEFLDWHAKFKANSTGRYVDAILKKINRRYDPDLNDIVPINGSEHIHSNKSSYKNRRLLYWIAFFDGLEKLKLKMVYHNSSSWNKEVKLVPDTDGTLKAWWFLVKKFYKLGIHPINIARLINYEMEKANEQAYQPLFVDPAKLPKLITQFSKCLRNLIKHYSVPVVSPPPRTTPYDVIDLPVYISEDVEYEEKIMEQDE